jgi:hypothetical protein
MPDATKRTRMRMPEKIAMMAHNIQAGKNVPNKKISGAMTLKRPGNFDMDFVCRTNTVQSRRPAKLWDVTIFLHLLSWKPWPITIDMSV